MTNELAVRRLDESQIDLVKATIAKGCSDDELALFVEQCNRTQLDPFARQIYAVSRWDGKLGRNVMTTQVSIDGARLVAQRSGDYCGQTPVFYCGADRQWTDLWLDSDGLPLAAKVGVYRRGFTDALWATATWEQYAAYLKSNEGGRYLAPMWKKMPALMLGKCAESLALRRGFPQELSGLYTEEEMAQADNEVPEDAPKVTTRREPPKRAADDRVVDAEVVDAETIIRPDSPGPPDAERRVPAFCASLHIRAKELGITDYHLAAIVEYVTAGRTRSTKDLKVREASSVNEVLTGCAGGDYVFQGDGADTTMVVA